MIRSTCPHRGGLVGRGLVLMEDRMETKVKRGEVRSIEEQR
jgi:hypothetical protein